mmetsp:Transcript_46729/g.118281  ORF Transcript_46729/g.118281 Transcript_46729/m.118281 type:complete len:247 (+) Transcript_46729:887-1627(+)
MPRAVAVRRKEAVERHALAGLQRHHDGEVARGGDEAQRARHVRGEVRVEEQRRRALPHRPAVEHELAQEAAGLEVVDDRLVALSDVHVLAVAHAVRGAAADVLAVGGCRGAVETEHHVVRVDLLAGAPPQQDAAAPHQRTAAVLCARDNVRRRQHRSQLPPQLRRYGVQDAQLLAGRFCHQRVQPGQVVRSQHNWAGVPRAACAPGGHLRCHPAPGAAVQGGAAAALRAMRRASPGAQHPARHSPA